MTDRRNILLTVAWYWGCSQWPPKWRGGIGWANAPVAAACSSGFLMFVKKAHPIRTYTTKRLWGGQRSHTAACRIQATCFTCAWGASGVLISDHIRLVADGLGTPVATIPQ